MRCIPGSFEIFVPRMSFTVAESDANVWATVPAASTTSMRTSPCVSAPSQ